MTRAHAPPQVGRARRGSVALSTVCAESDAAGGRSFAEQVLVPHGARRGRSVHPSAGGADRAFPSAAQLRLQLEVTQRMLVEEQPVPEPADASDGESTAIGRHFEQPLAEATLHQLDGCRLALRHAGTKPAEAQGLPDRVAEVGAPAFYYCKILLGSLLPY